MLKEAEFPWEIDFSFLEPQIDGKGVHVWPFDPSFPLDVRFFECGDHHSVRFNRHDYFELVYAYSGESTFIIQDRHSSLKSGDLLMIGSTLYHRQLANSDGTTDRVVILVFHPELIRSTTTNEDNVEYLLPFFSQDSEFPHVIPAHTSLPARIFELIREIHAELPATSTRARLTVTTYLKMILILLVKHYSNQLGSQNSYNLKQKAIDRLHGLFEWMDRYYGDPIAVGDAAKISGMSISYFMRFFKQVTGQSFLSYLNHFRVAKAQELLATTDSPIAEISQKIGFCDQSHFGMVFRKIVGATPMSYRRRYGNIVEDTFSNLDDGLREHKSQTIRHVLPLKKRRSHSSVFL